MNFEKFTVKSQEAIRKIVKIQFDQIKIIAAGQQIDLEITDKATDHLAAIGFDPVFGALPLKRVTQKQITNELPKISWPVIFQWIKK